MQLYVNVALIDCSTYKIVYTEFRIENIYQVKICSWHFIQFHKSNKSPSITCSLCSSLDALQPNIALKPEPHLIELNHSHTLLINVTTMIRNSPYSRKVFQYPMHVFQWTASSPMTSALNIDTILKKTKRIPWRPRHFIVQHYNWI